ncbi:MAG: plasmid pRiA4b ORF-3 family protein [Bacteroidota bacterium]
MSDVIQLNISIQHSEPLIFRTVLVKKETTFFELHHIIQIVMGWQNYHLFEFNLEGYRVGLIEESEKRNGYGSDQVLDASQLKITDILSCEKETFLYNYDFGDCWMHEISIEKVLKKEAKVVYPMCIDGNYNCPPEDCGGILGFYHILNIIQDKTHPEYKETRQWVGKKYDPATFDKNKVNRKLRQLRSYIARWNSFE